MSTFKVEKATCKSCECRDAMKGHDYCSPCNRKILNSFSSAMVFAKEDAKLRTENKEKLQKMEETMNNINKKRKAEFHAAAASSDSTTRGEAPTPETRGTPPAPARTVPTPMEREVEEVPLENNSRSRKEVQVLTERLNKVTDEYTNFAKASQLREEQLRENISELRKEFGSTIDKMNKFAETYIQSVNESQMREEAAEKKIDELTRKFNILNDLYKKDIEALESQLSNEMRSNEKLEAKIDILGKGMTVLRDNIKSKNLQKAFDSTTNHNFGDNSLVDSMKRVEV